MTVNYEGGSLTATVGVIREIFGSTWSGFTAGSTTTDVSVRGHSRTRVIGGPSTQVSAYSYSYKKWPTSEASNNAGGAVVLMNWEGSLGTWTGRVTGSMADFGDFLNKESPQPTYFRTERGTKYGPFQKP